MMKLKKKNRMHLLVYCSNEMKKIKSNFSTVIHNNIKNLYTVTKRLKNLQPRSKKSCVREAKFDPKYLNLNLKLIPCVSCNLII